MTELYTHKPVLQGNRVADPSDSVRILFISRLLISISLIVAGVIVLWMGYQLLMASIPQQQHDKWLLSIAGGLFVISFKGFAAFVMLSAVVPFIYAYKALPDRRREPVLSAPENNEEPPAAYDLPANDAAESNVVRARDRRR